MLFMLVQAVLDRPVLAVPRDRCVRRRPTALPTGRGTRAAAGISPLAAQRWRIDAALLDVEGSALSCLWVVPVQALSRTPFPRPRLAPRTTCHPPPFSAVRGVRTFILVLHGADSMNAGGSMTEVIDAVAAERHGGTPPMRYNATAMEDVLVMVPQFSSCMCVAQFTDDNADGYDMCRADATGEWRSGAHEF